jgi:hypothetical protein
LRDEQSRCLQSRSDALTGNLGASRADGFDDLGVVDAMEVFEATRWTGRPGDQLNSVVGMALAKSIYAVPTRTRLVAPVTSIPAMRATVSAPTPIPRVYTCYRFTTKLRANGDMLARCIDRIPPPCMPNTGHGPRREVDGCDMREPRERRTGECMPQPPT